MRRSSRQRHATLLILANFLLSGALSGCATNYNARDVEATPIQIAQQEIPETELLDVGIVVFESAELTDEEIQDKGTNNDIRQSEAHFIPCHLRNTLQRSAQWGAVRVMPEENASHEVLLTGEILESNGQELVLKIKVTDASGHQWYEETYRQEAEGAAYKDNIPWEQDAYQDLYNTIANDLAAYRQKLPPGSVKQIHSIAKLKFARDFAPDAYGDYLREDDEQRLTLNRLPADDDPHMARLMTIRERDHLYIDTLNQYYDGFYAGMWPAYENWRKLDLTERLARDEISRSSLMRKAGGALLVALAILAEATGTGAGPMLNSMMAVSGGQIFMSGINLSKQVEMHSAAIEELSESFGADMEPVNLELKGQTYELTGSAQEQYQQWRQLLQQIYLQETGFGPPADDGPDATLAD
ncbi:MAG: hypothetical protein QNJ61_10960 [Desulfobacterales bacterium]|nr:hypothetical protein [Desulfobacterales bacterium]